ncbi:30S ribosomal protein S14 [Candidatus Woesearchaeota archaeon]|nr:30S ribosomal protein S14 [Candidatus Woesearchaeota archaeon]
MKHNAPKPRKFGRSVNKCIRCGRVGGHVGKYGMSLCRQCFREIAHSLGFRKFN